MVRSWLRQLNFSPSIPPSPSRFKMFLLCFYPHLSASIRGKKLFWLIASYYLPDAFFSSRHALTAFTNWGATSAAPNGSENGRSPLPETRTMVVGCSALRNPGTHCVSVGDPGLSPWTTQWESFLNGLIALQGRVWFGLVRVLVLREARKCRTEQKSCKDELGSFSVKPHGLVSSCGNQVGSANRPQCSAGKIAVNCVSILGQVFWIE
jgi:hypothetical protein